MTENMIEEDERERLGSRVQIPVKWVDFLNQIENFPPEVEKVKYIAQEFGSMIVDLSLFMVENPITVHSSTNMDIVQ
jgi:hypothetical protein